MGLRRPKRSSTHCREDHEIKDTGPILTTDEMLTEDPQGA